MENPDTWHTSAFKCSISLQYTHSHSSILSFHWTTWSTYHSTNTITFGPKPVHNTKYLHPIICTKLSTQNSNTNLPQQFLRLPNQLHQSTPSPAYVPITFIPNTHIYSSLHNTTTSFRLKLHSNLTLDQPCNPHCNTYNHPRQSLVHAL